MRHLEKILCAALLAAALPSAATPIHGKNAWPQALCQAYSFECIFSQDILDGTSNTIFLDAIKGRRFRPNPPAPPASAVPEPGTVALMGFGLVGLGLAARRGRRRSVKG